MPTTDPFKETISAHLQSVAKNDKLFAETLKKPNKNIDECIKYIYSEVKKTGRCGFNDDEIFQMAIHYYDEDSIKEVPTVTKPQVNHTAEKPTITTSAPKPLSREAKKASKQKNTGTQVSFQFD